MYRLAVVALLMGGCGGCGKPAKTAEPTENKGSGGTEEKVAVPTDKGSAEGAAPVPAAEFSEADIKKAEDNKAMHLTPEEGTLTVGKAEGKAGAPATADIKLTPGSGFHVSTDFPIKLKLLEPSGVKLDKKLITAGKGGKGDADTLTEQLLDIKVVATAATAGSYEIKGVLNVGVCEKDSCHPRSQPITIQVAAN